MVRSLQGAGEENRVAPVQRYKKLTQKGWPMLSIAGGIYPGQLQAFYELLGPDVAWFLGGGVALHKDGPKAGAALCVRIAKEAAANKAKAGKDWSADISESLSEQADSMFKDRSLLSDDQLRYVSPKTHLSKVYGLAPYAS
jgi:ribulose 1,5-bisphosphate carboxylase large subunit-like protein